MTTRTKSLATLYAKAKPTLRKRILAKLSPDHLAQLVRIPDLNPWWWYGRPEQMEPTRLAPSGKRWRWWLICAGRGFGKTRAGAEWVCMQARRYPGCRIALVAATVADARDTMVEGDSGILSCIDPNELRGGSVETAWNRSIGELYFANGSSMRTYSSEKPRALRGPQFHFIWGDEPAYWNDVAKGCARDSTFSNANISLRLKPRKGWDNDFRPRGILTTTPRLVPLLKAPADLVAERPEMAGLLQRPDTVTTTGSTMSNLDNLDKGYYDAVVAPMIGTTLGQQELGGILLEQVEGALWTQAQIGLLRAGEGDNPQMPAPHDLAKTVVAFDPAGGGGVSHDEHGIIVASSSGTLSDLQLWVREDRSANTDVDTAARRVILAAYEFSADAIVYEKNQGQDWIGSVLRSTYAAMIESGDLPADWRLPTPEGVPAIKSKLQRATPVQGYYLQRRVRHVGLFPVLEGQMTTWVPGETESPDRLDALVWALTWLYGTGPSTGHVASPARRERGGRRADQPSSRLPSVYGARSARR